ncbi:glycosyltransferase family 39 protein [Tautonia plasticadhaerens]|uniref:Glycosyltransferase RgtA/B/C/D-like domain-containing protein n=1 Tax=Tautonia plasticadhaerens TaxID=2527974 RepID=A0A518H4U3_9BACT|nr:glycosyltransferase family 39 protein [Tautonia plasticadhaerens]QDV35848.1 hypothetical protein ElP_37560 [Tautonia plasticadhaerens]
MTDDAPPRHDDMTAPEAPSGPFRRVAWVASIGAVLAVLALAGWFRLSSLGAIPVHLADESYYGLQSSRMARGESFRMHTTSGNLVDPFLLLPQAALHLAFEPSTWVMRLPVALSGLAAVGMLFLAARRLDRGTATLAAVLLATTPKAIMFSRIGCEFGQTPLVGAVAAWFALRGRGVGLVLTLLAGQLVHPTNVLLVPILVPVFLVRFRGRFADDPGGLRRAFRRWSIAAGVAVLGVAVALLRRPFLRQMLRARFEGWSWSDAPIYLDLAALFPFHGTLLGLDADRHGRLVWAVALAVLLPGVIRLAIGRRWDRLAIVAGATLGLASLYVLGGATVLGPTDRYGTVLLVPGALASGCLIMALLPGRRSAPAPAPAVDRPRPPVAPNLLAAAIGGGLLVVSYANVVSPVANAPESIWTFRDEARDPYRRAIEVIEADMAGSDSGAPAGRPRLIIAQDYFVSTPLSYLAGGRGDLVVAELITIPELGELVVGRDPLAAERPRLADRLAEGDYAVSGHSIFPQLMAFIGEVARDGFPADRVRHWPVSGPLNLAVYRVAPPARAVARDGPDARRR